MGSSRLRASAESFSGFPFGNQSPTLATAEGEKGDHPPTHNSRTAAGGRNHPPPNSRRRRRRNPAAPDSRRADRRNHPEGDYLGEALNYINLLTLPPKRNNSRKAKRLITQKHKGNEEETATSRIIADLMITEYCPLPCPLPQLFFSISYSIPANTLCS